MEQTENIRNRKPGLVKKKKQPKNQACGLQKSWLESSLSREDKPHTVLYSYSYTVALGHKKDVQQTEQCNKHKSGKFNRKGRAE